MVDSRLKYGAKDGCAVIHQDAYHKITPFLKKKKEKNKRQSKKNGKEGKKKQRKRSKPFHFLTHPTEVIPNKKNVVMFVEQI